MTQYCKMLEIGDTADAATLLDYYEGFRGILFGYNIYCDYSSLPNYITYSPPINDVIYVVDVLEEMNKTDYVRN